MSARLIDIAAETGITPTAVSYVLNGRAHKVGKATREKVLQAVARLGYHPNSSARAVRKGRHGALALIMSPGPHRSLLTPEMVLGITRALARNNLRLLIDYVTDEQLTSEDALPRLLIERACDGMLLNYHAHIPPMLEPLTEHFHIPTVWINAKHDHNSVCPDDHGAAQLATETLIAEGHRRIAYSDASFNAATAAGDIHFSKLARRAGYEAAMAAAALPTELLLDQAPAGLTRRENVTAYADQLRATFRRRRPRRPPTAVLSYGGWGLEVLRQVFCEQSATVELMAFGITDNMINDRLIRGLIIPMEEVGERAVDMLLRRISDPTLRIPSETIPFRWSDPTC